MPVPLELPGTGTATTTPATPTGTGTTGTGTTTAPAAGGGAAAAATTLTAGGSTAAFVAAAEKLRTDWGTYANADARGTALGQAAAAQLTAIGVHAPTVAIADLPAGNPGAFDFTTWTLTLARAPFAGATANAAQINDVAATVFHEARHCEQWFRMARLRAGQGRTAAQIRTEMGIAAAAATAAHANPIAAGSAEATQAQVWWDNVYGTGAANRNTVLTEVMAALNALNDARKADAAGSTQATRTALAAAQTRFNTAHAAYMALAEEADAFAAEATLQAAIAAARAAASTAPATTGTPAPATGGTGGS